MNAAEIMALAVSMAGFDSVPQDSFIFHDSGPASRVLFGIDIAKSDLEAARSRGFDLVVAHHPPFSGAIARVLKRQVEIMVGAGVDRDAAGRAYDELAAGLVRGPVEVLVEEGRRKFEEAAARLGVGFMNVHLPCDELGRIAMQAVADSTGAGETLGALVAAFEEMPEIAGSTERVRLVAGASDEPAGRTVVVHAAGTNGGAPVAEALFASGVDTVVYIHLMKNHEERLLASGRGKLIVTGHHGSDSIGINVLVDRLRRDGIGVVTCNGIVEAEGARKGRS